MCTTKATFGFPDARLEEARDLLHCRGPIIPVEIGFDPNFNRASIEPPKLPQCLYNALLDTGADNNAVDKALARDLGLKESEPTTVLGITGHCEEAPTFMTQINIPKVGYSIHGKVAGLELRTRHRPVHAIIGRSFLRSFKLTYEGARGVFALEHSCPSS